MYSPEDSCMVIQEFKNITLSKQDKEEKYGKHQSTQLMEKADSALEQIETKYYCEMVPKHVTMLHEYGITFLGVYCTIVGRSLLWKKAGKKWMVTNKYSSNEDKAHCNHMYASPSSS